ncbi:hypothetical protein BH09VER1_BH09VER1_31900 [soil metagenome]
MNSAKDHVGFGSSVVAGMGRLICADVSVFQVLDREAQRIVTCMSPPEPFTPEEIAYYTAHSDEMPMVSYYARTNDPQARRMSDIVDESEWLSSKYYETCLARLALPYCLVLPITINASTVAALSFNRAGTDFSLRDCELLDAFAPHFRLAWERHENPWADQRQFDALRQFRQLGLSPRESEALFWMTEGKQNREIATILGVQLGTVQEHVAGILHKLRQENRHAATVFALRSLQGR